MRLSLTLEPDDSRNGKLLHRGRLLIVGNPSLADLSAELLLPGRVPVLRVAQVDLDYVYDPSPSQQEAVCWIASRNSTSVTCSCRPLPIRMVTAAPMRSTFPTGICRFVPTSSTGWHGS
jgi:hypothetical protein